MEQRGIFSRWKKTLGYLCLVILILFLVGLFSINYLGGIAITAGIIIYLVISRWLKSVLGKILFSIVLILAALFGLRLVLTSHLSTGLSPCAISYYRVVAVPQTSQLHKITIQEFVVLNDNSSFSVPADWIATYVDDLAGYSLPGIEATIIKRGFLLEEVNFQSAMPCKPKVTVELDDFPLNAFYESFYAQDLHKYPYIDTETITWDSLSEDIRFSFIKPPFQIVKPLLMPLIGVNTISEWFIGIFGIIGALIFTPIIKPLLIEIAQNQLMEIFFRDKRKQKSAASQKKGSKRKKDHES
jgi:hypothetical protein